MHEIIKKDKGLYQKMIVVDMDGTLLHLNIGGLVTQNIVIHRFVF